MSTATPSPTSRTLSALFGSHARAAVLACLFTRPEEEVFLRDIARHCGMAVTPVYRQLRKLEEIELVESRMLGKARAYRLLQDFPGLPALRELVTTTAGVRSLLAEAVRDLPIDVAFVFGSFAAGTERADSDVDVFVVGEVTGSDLIDALRPVEERIGREINPVYYTPQDFRTRMQDPSAFLDKVMTSAKLLIRGDEDALRRLTQQ